MYCIVRRPKGDRREPGLSGEPGPPGDKGNAGGKGVPGISSYSGVPGKRGPSGLIGMPRQQGEKGEPGHINNEEFKQQLFNVINSGFMKWLDIEDSKFAGTEYVCWNKLNKICCFKILVNYLLSKTENVEMLIGKIFN